jgi:hypothetical protein
MDYQAIAGELLDHRRIPEDLTEDQQVLLINEAAQQASDRTQQGEDMDDEVENLVIWLGGLRKDLLLYGLQQIHVYHKVNYTASDEVLQRVNAVADQLNRITTGYIASTASTVDRHNWPREFLDGSTFADRLMDLEPGDFAEEAGLQSQLAQLPTADQIIMGTNGEYTGPMDVSIQYALVTALCYEISDNYQKLGGKANTVTDEQLIRTFTWGRRHLDIETNYLLFKGVLAWHRIMFSDSTRVVESIDPQVIATFQSMN